MLISYATDKGLVRVQNEDSYLVYKEQVFAVADGMGGHAAGEVASRTIIDTIRKEIENKSNILQDDLVQLIKNANGTIFRNASEHEEYAGMGSTISLLALEDGKAVWVHVGDSRIYRLRGEELIQITTDHSFINELKAHQEEIPMVVNEAKGKNILTRAVGVAYSLKVDTDVENYEKGDKYILCTDGLTNMVPIDEIKAICMNNSKDKARDLVDKALTYGGRDNVTCIVVEIDD